MLKIFVAAVLIRTIACDELLSVVVLYRHGDRTPIRPYPTDPYGNVSYWPVDFGQLTNLGKMQHLLLGKWLRARYDGFLPSEYSEKDVYVRSTDADRTLMSAASNLAGLFPPKRDQVWDPDIPWQPIPIHTVPELDDNLLSMKKNCPKYNLLLDDLFQTDYFVNISKRNRDLYAYLTKQTGATIDSLEQLEYVYNTLTIEKFYNFTLPEWTKLVYPDKMKPWADFSFATMCYTQELARFRTGPFFHETIEFFTNATLNVTDYRKLLVLSAHDSNIANVLNTMGAFQYHSPPYASTILFELRRSSDVYINVFYRNSSRLQKITLKGCEFNCKFSDFVDILKPIVMTKAEWDLECQLGLFVFQLNSVWVALVLVALVFSMVGSLALVWTVKCCKSRPKGGDALYTQLPIDEVA